MFTSVLKHISRLESYQSHDNIFELRFVVAYPSAHTKDPVLRITLKNCAKEDFEALIQNVAHDLVEGIDITNSLVKLQVDGVARPVIISAKATHAHEDFSLADLMSLAARFETQLESTRVEVRELNHRVKQVVCFIDDQIERSVRKSTSDESIRAIMLSKVDLLHRIKTKLSDK